jgi:hypothetical protein
MYRAASAPSYAGRQPRHSISQADRQAGHAHIRRYGFALLRRHVTPASRRGAGTHCRADGSRQPIHLITQETLYKEKQRVGHRKLKQH